MAKEKPQVWCDISCDVCGTVAQKSGYYYKGIIGELHKSTKDWKNNICPSCQKEIELDDEDLGNMISCEIVCDECGAIIGGSYHKGSITELRKNTKDWIVKDGMILCPICQDKYVR